MFPGYLIKQSIQHCYKRKAILDKLNPILFDVSLRDGIQSAKSENFPLPKKIQLFHSIIHANTATKIEVGSLVSSKILPVFNDSLVLFNHANKKIHDIQTRHESCRDLDDISNIKIPKLFMLISSIEKLKLAFDHNVQHFSFITSVSNEFQLKNTRKSVQDAKQQFQTMIDMIIREPGSQLYQTKLYISCTNECPISGKIDNDFILKEILTYHTDFIFDELCLSDTMGTLHIDDFSYILDSCLFFGIPPSKISLHLHVKPENMGNVRDILFYAFSKNIHKFDVSYLETGGCSVTMGKNAPSNLTYLQFYSILLQYINRKIYLESL